MALEPTELAAADRCEAMTPSLFDGYNHRDVFPQAGKDMGTLAKAVARHADIAVAAADAMQGTSATSTAIATGSKVFTTQAGRSFAVGRYVQIVSAANRAGRQMSGMVTAYSGTSLTVDISSVIGSGTAADWLIFLSGPAGKGEQGIQGTKGDTGDQGIQGVKGDKGDTGDQGLQGIQGEQGPAGAKGDKGDRGESFSVDASGTLAGRDAYDGEDPGFAYLDIDNGHLYFRLDPTGWSSAIPFGKGDKGDAGDKGDTGDQGIQGVKGDKGDQGDQGVKGDTGDPANASTVATAIAGATAKTTPVDADTLPLIDSAASNALKKVTWANIKATLKDYFDGIYAAASSVLSIASTAEVRTGSDTAKALGVKNTWDALAPVALTDASTVAINLTNGINFSLTLGGNRTLGNPTSSGGWKAGQQGEITVSRAGTQTLSFASNWVAFGSATLPTTSAKGFKVVYEVISSTVIHFNVVGQA